MGPAEPWPPPGPAAHLPMKAETSLPPAQLTPMAPGVLCGQHFKGDARMGYGVGGQPFPKPSFAANTSFGKSSGLRGSEKKQCYIGWTLCALDIYQIPGRKWTGSIITRPPLGVLFTSWDTEALMCKEVFTSPCLPQVLLNVTRLHDEVWTLISFCIQPISPSTVNWKLPENYWSKFLQHRRGCSCVFASWFPACCYECQTPAFPLKRPNKAFTWAVSYSTAFYISFSWPFERIKKLSDICTWGKSLQLTLHANSECL